MDTLDRRSFLIAATASLAACDRVVVEVGGEDGVEVDANGNAFIPPITPNDKFYVYQYFRLPEFDPNAWKLSVRDTDGTPLGTIDRALIDSLTPRDIELTLQCIGASVVSKRIGNAVWTGLPLSEVLEAAGIPGPRPDTQEIVMRGADTYDASVPVSDYDQAPMWLIWGMNGEELPFDHGAPARIMIPGRYGIKNLKWITEIQWFDGEYVAYWDELGWSHTGEYKVNGFIHLPSWDATVSKPVTVLGSAFAGRDPIVKVELTDDGGETWMECDLEYAPGADRWVLWKRIWRPRDTGKMEIQVRATTEGGQVTSMDPSGTSPKDGYDGGQLLPLTVV